MKTYYFHELLPYGQDPKDRHYCDGTQWAFTQSRALPADHELQTEWPELTSQWEIAMEENPEGIITKTKKWVLDYREYPLTITSPVDDPLSNPSNGQVFDTRYKSLLVGWSELCDLIVSSEFELIDARDSLDAEYGDQERCEIYYLGENERKEECIVRIDYDKDWKPVEVSITVGISGTTPHYDQTWTDLDLAAISLKQALALFNQ